MTIFFSSQVIAHKKIVLQSDCRAESCRQCNAAVHSEVTWSPPREGRTMPLNVIMIVPETMIAMKTSFQGCCRTMNGEKNNEMSISEPFVPLVLKIGIISSVFARRCRITKQPPILQRYSGIFNVILVCPNSTR